MHSVAHAHHATMRHTAWHARRFVIPVKVASARLAPRGERVHVRLAWHQEWPAHGEIELGVLLCRTAWCGSTPTCAWPTSRSTPSTTSSSCAPFARQLQLERYRVPATVACKHASMGASRLFMRLPRCRPCARAQHLKSTPADYFWWRFKSGEDREGLEKVTRKVTAAEAAQKDADIKAVSRTRQASIIGPVGARSGRRKAVLLLCPSLTTQLGLMWARATGECACGQAESWGSVAAGLCGLGPPVCACE